MTPESLTGMEGSYKKSPPQRPVTRAKVAAGPRGKPVRRRQPPGPCKPSWDRTGSRNPRNWRPTFGRPPTAHEHPKDQSIGIIGILLCHQSLEDSQRLRPDSSRDNTASEAFALWGGFRYIDMNLLPNGSLHLFYPRGGLLPFAGTYRLNQGTQYNFSPCGILSSWSAVRLRLFLVIYTDLFFLPDLT